MAEDVSHDPHDATEEQGVGMRYMTADVRTTWTQHQYCDSRSHGPRTHIRVIRRPSIHFSVSHPITENDPTRKPIRSYPIHPSVPRFIPRSPRERLPTSSTGLFLDLPPCFPPNRVDTSSKYIENLLQR